MKKKHVKKQEDRIEDIDVLAKLNPAQYWEWLCGTEQIENAKLLKIIAEQRVKIQELEINIAHHKLNTMRRNIENAINCVKNVENEYNKHRGKLETELGLSLKDCTIGMDGSIRRL